MKQYSVPRRLWRIINPLLIYLGITFGVGIIFGVVLGVAIALLSALSGSVNVIDLAAELQRITIEYAMPILITCNVVALGVYAPMWVNSRKRLERSRNIAPAPSYALTIGLFAAFNIVITCVITLLDSSFNLMSNFSSYEGLDSIFTKGSFITQFLAVGVCAPVVEEMCFRGILMERMRWIPVWLAIPVQAILFAVAHMNLFQASYALILGVMLGLVYIKFRSIIIVIAGHAAFNITSLILYAADAELNLYATLIPAAVATVVCAVFLVRRPSAIVQPDFSQTAQDVVTLDYV